jgi:integrase
MNANGGSVFKRCACTEPVLDATGNPARRQLGATCPRLRRPDGTWSNRHGAWYYVLELPDIPGDRRRQLKRGGHAGAQQARDALAQVRDLIAVADDADAPGTARAQIIETIRACHRDGTQLPGTEELRHLLLAGRSVARPVTVGEWLSEWLAGKADLRASTRRAYTSHIRLYLAPHLGHVRLDRLRVAHLHALFTAIEDRNTHLQAVKDARAQARTDLAAARTRTAARAARARLHALPAVPDRQVGPATMHRIRATLRVALSDAAAQGLITTNVAKLVKLPSGRRPRALVWTDERVTGWQATGRPPSPIMVWTPHQTSTFLSASRPHLLYALFHLVAHTGLRRGESVGLRWADLALDRPGGRATLTVAHQIVQLGWATQAGAPKTSAGERVIGLDPGTVTVLRAHRRRQRAQRLAAGPAWTDTGHVFTRPDGHPWHPADVTDAFTAAAAAAGLPPIRLHDLRHGTATHALAAGIDIKVVQEILGHSSSVITRDTYTSVLDEAKHAAAAAIAAQLGAAPTPRRPRPQTPPAS